MKIRLVTATVAGAAFLATPASVVVLALTPSVAAAQDDGLVDPATLRRIELVKDLERGLRQGEAARLRGDCDRIETLTGMFYGMHMKRLPPEVEADFQRRWREISSRPCPPEAAAPPSPPPPQAKPEDVPAPPASDAPPAEDIPSYDAEPAPPEFGSKPPSIGVPYRDPNATMIIPLPPKESGGGGEPKPDGAQAPGSAPPKTSETAPPPPKPAGQGASEKPQECGEGTPAGPCEPARKPREGRPPR